MYKEYPIVAEDVDSEEDSGFNVRFDRPYNILKEKLPLTSDAATRAIEAAYTWGYDPREMNEGEQVGVVVIEDREFVEARCTA